MYVQLRYTICPLQDFHAGRGQVQANRDLRALCSTIMNMTMEVVIIVIQNLQTSIKLTEAMANAKSVIGVWGQERESTL